MPEILEDVAYLSRELGPRPAGTEEEQQAAHYLDDRFRRETNLSVEVQDIASNPNFDLIVSALGALAALFALLGSFIIPAAPIALLVGLACVALAAAELTNRPLLSKALARGESQNVIARYVPENGKGSRARKVVFIAHYDSGKVDPALSGGLFALYPFLQKAGLGAFVALPVWMLIRFLAAGALAGGVLVFFNVVSVLLALFAAIPCVLVALRMRAPYNDGANDNATGAAMLVELAKRVSWGPDGTPDAGEPVVHGEDEAREAGLVPDGATIEYADSLSPVRSGIEGASESEGEQPQIAERSAEKPDAAGSFESPVAPLPMEQGHGEAPSAVEEDAHEPVLSDDPANAIASPDEKLVEPASEEHVSRETSEPDWFKAAREKAKRSGKVVARPAQRSRYADALDSAVAASAAHFAHANRAVSRETEERIEQRGPEIVEVPAPEGLIRDASGYGYVNAEGRLEDQPKRHSSAPQVGAAQAQQEQMTDIEMETPSETPHFDEDGIAYREETDPQREVARLLQAKPSRRIEPAQRREGDRVLIEPEYRAARATGAGASLVTEVSDTEPASEERPNIAQIIPHVQQAPVFGAAAEEDDVATSNGDPTSENPHAGLSARIPRIAPLGDSDSALPDNKRAALGNLADPARSSLGAILPSLSGALAPVEPVAEQPAEEPVAVPGATGAFSPVVGELVSESTDDDLYIADADDSAYVEDTTETGAFAGPGYVEMPESRVGRFFSRFRRKKEKQELDHQSTSDWLDVDESFTAPEVGAARGGWESFQQPSSGSRRQSDYDDWEDSDYTWKGGAFSKVRSLGTEALGRGRSSRPTAEEDEAALHAAERQQRLSSIDDDLASLRAVSELLNGGEIAQIEEETRLIQGFNDAQVNVECWFVALGSSCGSRSGMQAFLDAHKADLRGAIVVNLEGLGAGELALVEQEGSLKPTSVGNRVARMIQRAASASDIGLSRAKMPWRDSAASLAREAGLQGVTIAGMSGGKVAYSGEAGDVFSNIDGALLRERADLLMRFVESV